MPVFTTVGEQKYVDYIIAAATWYCGWGTGTTAEVKGDTALETAASEARSAMTPTDNGDNFDLVGTIISLSAQTISEVGIFDASTSGNMVIRDAFTGVVLAIDDGIEFTVNQELA